MHANPTECGAPLARATLGVMFIAHALFEGVVFTVSGTVQFLESMGRPGFLAYVTVAAVLLIAGYRTRLVALASLPILLGAAWAHLPNG